MSVQKQGVTHHCSVSSVSSASDAEETEESGRFLQLGGILDTRPPDATPPPWGGTVAGGTAAAGGAAEGAGLESVTLDSCPYHSTRPPFVKGVAENANDSSG